MILSPLFMIGAVLAYLLVRELGKEEQRKQKQGLLNMTLLFLFSSHNSMFRRQNKSDTEIKEKEEKGVNNSL